MSRKSSRIINNSRRTIAEPLEFRDEIMNGTFRILLFAEDPLFAEQVAQEVFREIARLETFLSRFVPGSDVGRLNRLRQGQFAPVSLETFRCLEIAETIRIATAGLFDVAFRSGDCPRNENLPRFELRTQPPRVGSLTENLQIDLGGIGKGYALDLAAKILEHYELTESILWADRSTVLALDHPKPDEGWEVEIGPDHRLIRQSIRRKAISASGTTVRGEHVFNPRSGRFESRHRRCWVSAATAAESDAFATAALLLPESEIESWKTRLSLEIWTEDRGELKIENGTPRP